MLVFPQLTTGSAALYPIRRRRSARTVRNELRDGATVVYRDPDWVRTEWELEAAGWTAAEWAAVEELFEAARGQFGTFTFLDPAGNLLCQSEALEAPEWDRGPLVMVAEGIDDPMGGSSARRVTNGGPADADIYQTLAVPGDFVYALSGWVRASGTQMVTLFAETVGAAVERRFEAREEWRRVWMTVGLDAPTEEVLFGVRLALGQALDLFGLQVEAQPGVGDYQRTGSRGGVHSRARFASDVLNVQARSSDAFDSVVRIVSKGK